MKKIILFLISIFISSSIGYAGHYEFAGDGARAKAMGGAFVAVADDASAYSWNPAGMALLQEPEMSFMSRMRAQNYRELYPYDPNRWEESRPPYVFENWHDAMVFRESEEGGGPPMGDMRVMSYVYPWKRMAIGFGTLGYKQYMSEVSTHDSGRGPVILNCGGNTVSLSWTSRYEMNMEFGPPDFGTALAFRLGRFFYFGFKVGICSAPDRLETNKSREEYFPKIAAGGNTITEPFYYWPWIRPESSLLSYSFGILLRLSRLSLGLVYKDFTTTRMVLQEGGAKNDTNYLYGIHNDFDFKYPRFIGGGVALRIGEVFTISYQANFIAYSQMDYDPGDNWVFEDATEHHVGVEYVLFLGKEKNIAFPLRFGWYLEPSAQDFYKFRNKPYPEWTDFDTEQMEKKYSKDPDQHHITLGTGFSRDQWSFDFTVDWCHRRIDIMFTPVLYF